MKIIALLGDSTRGKTTTLNLTYNILEQTKGTSVTQVKNQLGANTKDFEAILTLDNATTVAFFTMGDYSREIIDAIDKYHNLNIDILIVAVNNKFTKPKQKINNYSQSHSISKTLSTSSLPEQLANLKDAVDIISIVLQ